MLSKWLVAACCTTLASGYIQGSLPAEGRLNLADLDRVRGQACPCDDASLCNPVTVQHKKEVFGFAPGKDASEWDGLDYTQVTTIAWVTDIELVCTAHKHDARIIAGAPSMNLTELGINATARAEYVSSTVEMVKALFIDGVTFDFESPLAPGAPEANYYVQIIEETTEALHREVPGSQTSTCVAWSPNNIDGRFYNITGFASASDLLYVMMYDTRSQIFEQCIAAPNAALPLVEQGVQQYLSLGIDPQKLILGLPWYGYDYPCLNGTATDADFCRIPFAPFRGVNCSDAAGREIKFWMFMDILNNNATTTGRQWASDVGTPWFNYVAEDGIVHQMWMDDATSLAPKYLIAKKYNLRGTGPYLYAALNYSTPLQREQSKTMWDALRVFTQD